MMDMLAELGGLFSSLNQLGIFFVYFFQFEGIYQFLLHDLFIGRDAVKKESTCSRDELYMRTNSSVHLKNDVQWNSRKALRHNCLWFLPDLIKKFCCRGCCGITKRERLAMQNYRKLKNEIQITSILRKLRVLTALAKA